MIGIKIILVEEKEVSKALKRLAEDRSLYTDMILRAYSGAMGRAFRSQGFGEWEPLKKATIAKRRAGGAIDFDEIESRQHYALPSAPGVSARYPANTWTSALREFASGNTVTHTPLRFGRGVQNIRIRGGPWYGGYALDIRPLSESIMNHVVSIMEEKIRDGIIRNIDTHVTGGGGGNE